MNPGSGRAGSLLQMKRLSLSNKRLKFKTAGKFLIILEEFIEEYTQPNKGTPQEGCQHATWSCKH
jgi:hypothetical protein